MTQPTADYFPRGLSVYVPNCEYAVDADIDNKIHTVDFGAPLALSAAGLLLTVLMVSGAAVSVTDISTAAGGTGTATSIGFYGMVPYDSTTVFNGWGRNITAVASSANGRVLTLTGYDYLGQKMQEVLTMNSATTVQGLKAFAWLTSASWASGADATTVSVGWGNKLGLPFAGDAMVTEMKNQAVAANAGTFTGALIDATAATISNADTRGTYLPATVLPDGTNTFKIMYMKRSGNLHGNAQYTA